MAEFVDALDRLEQVEEGGDAGVRDVRVIGLNSPGGSEIGSDAEESESSEVMEGDTGRGGNYESSSSEEGDVLTPADDVIARLTRQMAQLSMERKIEARRVPRSPLKLREYQIRIHDTSIAIIAAKAELNRLRALQGTRGGGAAQTVTYVTATPVHTSYGNRVHRTPERGDNTTTTTRLRDERDAAVRGVERAVTQDERRAAYEKLSIDRVAAGVDRLASEAEQEATLARYYRAKSAKLAAAEQRRSRDTALASMLSEDARDARQKGDDARLSEDREQRERVREDKRLQDEKIRRETERLAELTSRGERSAVDASQIAQDVAGDVASVRRAEDERRAAAESVVIDVADAESNIERKETTLVIVVPTTARFQVIARTTKKKNLVVEDFGAFFQRTFAANPAFAIERVPKNNENGVYTLTIKTVNGPIALLVVQLLFAGILNHWATTSNIGAFADGYQTLLTEVWTDTLIPVFTAVCLAAQSALLKDPTNRYIIAFYQALKKSTGWLFTLALTGVTWYSESQRKHETMPDGSPVGQLAQPTHFRKRSMFETLGVDNGAFAGQLPALDLQTKNQLLSGDVGFTGKTLSEGISTPMLKMALTLQYAPVTLGIFTGRYHSIITQPNAAGERDVDWQAIAASPKFGKSANGSKIYAEDSTQAPESMLSRIYMLPVFEALLGPSMRRFVGTTTSYESVGLSLDEKFHETLSLVNTVFSGEEDPPYLNTAHETDPGRVFVSWKAPGDDSGMDEEEMRALVAILQATISARPPDATVFPRQSSRMLFETEDTLHYLAAFAKEIASAFQIATQESTASPDARLRAATAIVGGVMFTRIRLAEYEPSDEPSTLFTRFGRRPSGEVLDMGRLVIQYVETAAKSRRGEKKSNDTRGRSEKTKNDARGRSKSSDDRSQRSKSSDGRTQTKSSEFRPSILPQFAGGVSNKTLGALLESQASSRTTEFLRLAKEDGRVMDNLNDKDRKYKLTVLVPINSTWSAPSAAQLLTDAGAIYATIELHTLDEELDFEALSKSHNTRTVHTELAGYNINLSVEKGFSNSKGGTINIGGNDLKLIGGGRKLSVVSGPMRAKNGVYYLVDGLIDSTSAMKVYGEEVKKSEFRPSWFPVSAGGKSNKMLGMLIATSKQLPTKAFRTLMRDDPSILSMLNDADYEELTVFVPSTEALRSPDALVLLQDPDETRNAIEYHVFDAELDLERLSKNQQMHTVTSQFAGIPFRFSVNRGFSSDAGGTINLGNGVRQLGGGRSINVVGGPYRAKNGVYYVIDGVLDHYHASDAYKKLIAAKKQREDDLKGGTSNLGFTDAVNRANEPAMGNKLPPPPLPVGQLPPPLATNKSSRAKADYINQRIASSTAKRGHRTAKLTPPPTKKDRPRMLNTRPGRGKFMLHSMARGSTYLATFDNHVDTLMNPSGAVRKANPTLQSVSDREQLINWLHQRKEESRKTLPSTSKSRDGRGRYTNAKKKSATTSNEKVDDDDGSGEREAAEEQEEIVYKRHDKDGRNDMKHCFGPLLALFKATGVDAEIARVERPLAILAPEPSVLRALDLESMSAEQKKELLREHVLIAVWAAHGGHDATQSGLSPLQLAELVHGESSNKPVHFETLNGSDFAHVVLVPQSASERSIQNIDRKANIVLPSDIVSEKDVVYDDGVKRAHRVHVYMIDKVLAPNRLNVVDIRPALNSTTTGTRAAKMSQGVLVPLENASTSDKKSNSREWLLQFENTARAVREERDAIKFIEAIDRLEKHLDRIGGAVAVSPDLDRADIDKMFDKLEAAIAKNRNVDPMTKDDARQMLIDLRARFD